MPILSWTNFALPLPSLCYNRFPNPSHSTTTHTQTERESERLRVRERTNEINSGKKKLNEGHVLRDGEVQIRYMMQIRRECDSM